MQVSMSNMYRNGQTLTLKCQCFIDQTSTSILVMNFMSFNLSNQLRGLHLPSFGYLDISPIFLQIPGLADN